LDESAAVLKRLGLEPIAAPAVEVTEFSPGEDVLERVSASDFIVFISVRAVKVFFSCSRPVDGLLRSAAVISVGERTRAELEKHGVSSMKPVKYSSAGIVALISGMKSAGRSVAVLRSREGSRTLADGLMKLGYAVTEIPLYSVGYPQDDSRLLALIKDIERGERYAIPFTSAMIARNFFRCAENAGPMKEIVEKLANCSIWSIGPETSLVLRGAGVNFTESPVADYEAMAGMIASHAP
jgi:uroporphyrinogen-III synthase